MPFHWLIKNLSANQEHYYYQVDFWKTWSAVGKEIVTVLSFLTPHFLGIFFGPIGHCPQVLKFLAEHWCRNIIHNEMFSFICF